MKSKGLGDTVEKMARAVGADRVAQAFEKTTGKDCECNKRRNTLNRIFPYDR